MDDYIIREIKLPLSVQGFTLPDESGLYNIYVNCDLSDEAKRICLLHELRHIFNNDFSSSEAAVVIEKKENCYE